MILRTHILNPHRLHSSSFRDVDDPYVIEKTVNLAVQMTNR